MAAVAPKETDQQAAIAARSDNVTARPPAKLLDPQLLMAARRGDGKRLKELLGLRKDDDDDDESGMLAAKAEAKQVVVEVDRRRRLPSPPAAGAAAAQALLPLLDGHGVTAKAGDSLLHVVAASGDGQEFLDCATMIHDQVSKGLLVAQNNKGDTPLHCAARAGNADMISCLVGLVTGDEAAVKAFLRLQNDLGETALHHAVRAASKPAIDKLLSLDSELPLACSTESEGEESHAGASAGAGAASCCCGSPFYLAVSLGEMDIARHLFDDSSSRSKRKLSYYSGPYGRNVLHAAVSRGQVLAEILEWLKDEVVDLQQGGGRCHVQSVPLVSQLTSQMDRQQKGSTPLHLAASLNGWPGSRYLARGFPQVLPAAGSMATLLLDANISTAYQADDEGSYPIHVAAGSHSHSVVKVLLRRCPDCATLRDGQGRTFLHVAAEECDAVVGYACRMPRFSSILNAQQSNGDTALHAAVRAGNLTVFNCLLRNQQVRLDVANKDGMTPLDLSWTTNDPSKFQYVFNPRNVIQLLLRYSGAPHGGGRPELFIGKHITKGDADKESERYTAATQVMSIVAVLISTVTFASAFTLPGGYRGADDNGDSSGTPVLARGYAFDAFILADTLAFVCSTLATFCLVYAGVPAMDISVRSHYFNLSVLLLQSAGRSFVAAFALALYLVLAPVDRTIAISVCVIISSSLLYGNIEARRLTCMANTVRARIGIQRFAASDYAKVMLFNVLVHFGSFVIILGLPAIRKWARK